MHRERTSDVLLEGLVFAALERNPFVPQRDLRFEMQEGHVTLRGVVRSYYQKQMAQESLRGLEGIHEISNELEVRT